MDITEALVRGAIVGGAIFIVVMVARTLRRASRAARDALRR